MLAVQIETASPSNEVRTWANGTLPRIIRKWPTTFSVAVRFAENGVPIELGLNAIGDLIVRRVSDNLELALVQSWVKVGVGAGAYYVFLLNTNTDVTTPIFVSDPSLRFIETQCEIRFQPGDGSDDRSATFNIQLARGLRTGNEGVPVPGISADARYVLRNDQHIQFLANGIKLIGPLDLAVGGWITFQGSEFIDSYGSINLHGNGLCTTGGDQIIEPDGSIHLIGLGIFYGGEPLINSFGAFLERGSNQTIGFIDLAAAEGNFISLAGSGTVTSLGELPAGAEFTIYVQGNATFQPGDLLLPGGQNIYAVAGDVLTFRSTGGGGEWVLTGYLRAAVASSAVRLPNAALPLADGVIATVTSISVPRGRWDIIGWVTTEYSGPQIYGSVSAITTNAAAIPFDGTQIYSPTLLPGGDDAIETQVIPSRRVNLSAPTTYFLITMKSFSGGGAQAFGQISITPAA